MNLVSRSSDTVYVLASTDVGQGIGFGRVFSSLSNNGADLISLL
jgi:hypothetical protein